MRKLIFASLFCLAIFQSAFAGDFFTIQASGTPANLSVNLCLNAKASLSCQNYTVSGTDLQIKTTIPNRTYPLAGIKTITPGYQATQCKTLSNGYCQFSANNKTSTSVSLTAEGGGTAQIKVSGSPLILLPLVTGGTAYTSSLTVTNMSSATANNIKAALPSSWVDVTQDSSTCQSLAVGASCQLKFTAGSHYYALQTVPVYGSNTNSVNTSMIVTFPWTTDFNVNAMALDTTHQLLYIGGNFTYVGPPTGAGAILDSNGAAQTPYQRIKGEVAASVSDGAGGWYIGGSFTQVAGVTRNNIAHILANGSLDLDFDPNANYSVYALALSGSTLYVGGEFTNIGGQTRSKIAALNTTTGIATTWNPDANDIVDAIAISSNIVYVGGWFTNIDGQARNHIAALDATATTGIATTWNPNANDVVNAIAVSGNTIYAGGIFTTIGGLPRNYIAALDATTGTATAWDPNAIGASGYVNALAVSGSTIYVGGLFTTIGGQSRNNIAALDTSGGATPWNPDADGYINTLAINGNIIYAGGLFSNIGGQERGNIAALDAATGAATDWNLAANNYVDTIAISGNAVYVGGLFSSIGGQLRNSLAAIDTRTGAATTWNPSCDGYIYSLALGNNTVYTGGNFSTISGQVRNYIAAIDATTGAATAWDPEADSNVNAIVVSGNTVYAGGFFTNIGGQTQSYIAALDATTGTATAWNPNADSAVQALAINNDTIYAAGGFTHIGGQNRQYIAALNLTDGTATAWNPNAALLNKSKFSKASFWRKVISQQISNKACLKSLFY